MTGVKVESHTPSRDGTVTTVKAGDQTLDVEAVVVSVGRRPRTEGLVADGVGVEIDERGFVVADEYQRTGVDGVWAVGDIVAGTPQLAHVGFAEAIVAVKGMLGEPVVPVDNGKVPWAIYCHPEVAFCGMTEAQAKAAGIDVVTKKDPFGGNSRAQIIGDTEGLVKIVAEQRPDGTAGRILGVHMCGPVGDRAAERRLPGRQLGGVPRRGRAIHPAAPVAVRDLRRDDAGADRKGTPPWLTS